MHEHHDDIRQLVLEKLTGTISDEDNLRLQQLLDTDPGARELWEHYRQQAEALQLREVLENADESRALEALHARLPARRGARVRMIGWAAAAMIAVTAAGFWFFSQTAAVKPTAGSLAKSQLADSSVKLVLGNGAEVTLEANTKQQVAGNITLQTADNELHYTPGKGAAEMLNTLVIPPKKDYKIVLSDGTEVWLNAASSFRFPFAFNKASREVFLEGEAYFKVSHNPGKPFIVHTSHTDIRVYGTSFNVNTYKRDQVCASLVEGKVTAAAADGDSVKLQPGMEVVSDGNRMRTARFDPAVTLAWMEGLYYFSNIPLQNITGTLSRWFDTKVVFDDPATAKAMVSGVIEKGRLNDFLENLRVATGIHHHWKADVLHLK